MNPEHFDIYSIIRPMGLDINFTSSSFLSASGFILFLVAGKYFLKSKHMRYLCIFLTYIAVLLSTSRQVIFSMHIAIFFLLIIANLNKNRNRDYVIKQLRRFSKYITFLLLVVTILSFSWGLNTYNEFIYGLKGGTSAILINSFYNAPTKLLSYFTTYPFNALFGIGGYTPGNLGFYTNLPTLIELHFIMEIFYPMGLIGFILYWSIFYKSIKRSWWAFKVTQNKKYKEIYLAGVLLGILFAFNIVHYAPVGIITCFIVALIPAIAIIARKEIKKEMMLIN